MSTISSQDASILAYLDRESGLSPRALAHHLSVKPSTLSAAIARLAELGYITNTPAETDRRKRDIDLLRAELKLFLLLRSWTLNASAPW